MNSISLKIWTLLALLSLASSEILYDDQSFLLQYQTTLLDSTRYSPQPSLSLSLQFNPLLYPQGSLTLRFGVSIAFMDQIRLAWDIPSSLYAVYDGFLPHGLLHPRSKLDQIQNTRFGDAEILAQDLIEISFSRDLQTPDKKEDISLTLEEQMIFQVIIQGNESQIVAEKIFSRNLGESVRSELDSRVLQQTGDVTPLQTFTQVFGTKLYWQIDKMNQEITFYLETDLSGWFGVGFAPGMTNVDMAIITCFSGTVGTNLDYFSSSTSTPTLDTTQNIQVLGSEVQGGRLKKIKFKRKLTTTDTTQDQQIVPDQSVLWAFGQASGTTLSYHNQRGNFRFELCSECQGQQVSKKEENKKTLDAHRIFLMIGWGVWVDILVIFSMYMKHKNFYIDAHAIMAFLLDAGSIVLIALMLDQEGDMPGSTAESHKIIGIIFLALVCIHHIGGGFIKFQLDMNDSDIKNIKDRIHFVKRGHLATGFILYVLGKVQLFTGSDLYTKIDPEAKMSVVIIYQVIIIALIKVLPDLWYRLTTKKVGSVHHSEAQVKNDVYSSIISMIQDNQDRYQILQRYPSARYVIYHGSLYQVDNFNHPGGRYIIDQVIGREIDCYLYGGYALETTSLDPHTHSHYTGSVLSERFQGELIIPQDQNPMELQESKISKKEFTLDKKTKISDSISIFYLSSDKLNIKNSLKGVRWLGRHFTVFDAQQSDPKRRLYTTALCLTESNLQEQQNLLQFVADGLGGVYQPSKQTHSQSLPLVIKNYQTAGSFSSLIHNSTEGKSLFYVEGPHGLGLQLTESSKGLFVIFVGGTGILPFLDLFYLLLKISIQRVAQKQGKQIQLVEGGVFESGIKFLVYGAFQSEEDIVGIQFIEALNSLNQQHGLDLVEFRFKISKPKQGQSMLKTVEIVKQTFDRKLIETQFLSWKNLSRVYICGPPKMNKEVQKGLIEMNLNNKIFLV